MKLSEGQQINQSGKLTLEYTSFYKVLLHGYSNCNMLKTNTLTFCFLVKLLPDTFKF